IEELKAKPIDGRPNRNNRTIEQSEQSNQSNQSEQSFIEELSLPAGRLAGQITKSPNQQITKSPDQQINLRRPEPRRRRQINNKSLRQP
ncbi:MAG: hypothetical protein KDD12_28065, partial [Lewinella sp.]|nr:hypothetical protein [Lewinella sp.]